MNLVGLPHTTEDVPAVWARTPHRAMQRLTKKRAITAAGDSGAINAWFGDDGNWHAMLSRYCVTRDEITCKTKQELAPWFEKTFPTIE